MMMIIVCRSAARAVNTRQILCYAGAGARVVLRGSRRVLSSSAFAPRTKSTVLTSLSSHNNTHDDNGSGREDAKDNKEDEARDTLLQQLRQLQRQQQHDAVVAMFQWALDDDDEHHRFSSIDGDSLARRETEYDESMIDLSRIDDARLVRLLRVAVRSLRAGGEHEEKLRTFCLEMAHRVVLSGADEHRALVAFMVALRMMLEDECAPEQMESLVAFTLEPSPSVLLLLLHGVRSDAAAVERVLAQFDQRFVPPDMALATSRSTPISEALRVALHDHDTFDSRYDGADACLLELLAVVFRQLLGVRQLAAAAQLLMDVPVMGISAEPHDQLDGLKAELMQAYSRSLENAAALHAAPAERKAELVRGLWRAVQSPGGRRVLYASPNVYNAVICALASAKQHQRAISLFESITNDIDGRDDAVDFTDSTVMAMIRLYGLRGDCNASRQVLEDFGDTRSVLACNALLHAFVINEEWRLAWEWAHGMQSRGVSFDGDTFRLVLAACVGARDLECGRTWWQLLLQHPVVTPTVEHYRCMVRLHAQVGDLDSAAGMLEDARRRQVPLDARVCVTFARACLRRPALRPYVFRFMTKLEPGFNPLHQQLWSVRNRILSDSEAKLFRAFLHRVTSSDIGQRLSFLQNVIASAAKQEQRRDNSNEPSDREQ